MDTKLDMLITRVVDGVASPADWEALDAMGAAEPSVWRELAQAQRAEQLLKAAAGEAVAVSQYVELPQVIARVGEAGLKQRIGRVGTWGGWAAAAAIALAFFGHGQVANQNGNAATLLPLSADQAYKEYLAQGKKEGRVLGELPDRLLVDTTQTADGQYEVTFVRQIVEKVKVDGLYKPTTAEDGTPGRAKVRMVISSGKM